MGSTIACIKYYYYMISLTLVFGTNLALLLRHLVSHPLLCHVQSRMSAEVSWDGVVGGWCRSPCSKRVGVCAAALCPA